MNGKEEFKLLITRLINEPNTAYYGYKTVLLPGEEEFSNEPCFDGYCRKAVELIRTGQIDSSLIERELAISKAIPSLDARDYVTDLLRIIAKEIDDTKLQKMITEAHLKYYLLYIV